MTDAGAATGLGSTGGPAAPAGIARVGLATALSALCGYAVLYLAARSLGPAGFSVFAVFWGAFGLVTGAANGLLQEATREVRLAVTTEIPRTPVRPMWVAAGAGVAAGVLLASGSPLWAGRVFSGPVGLSVLLLGAGIAGFALHATLLGMLAGTGRWTQYGSLMVTDAGTRLVVAGCSFLLGWGVAGFLWATVAGSLAWLLLLTLSAGARSAARIRTAGTLRGYLRGASHSIAAAAASAVLVMGFPVLLKVTSGDLGAAGGVVILAVTMTRAPLLVPLTAMQGNLIAHLVDRRDSRLRGLAGPVAVVAGLGALGIAAAGLIGPWLIGVAFGPEYRTSAALLSWLTAGAVSIALLTLTGMATVAGALHRAYSLGWVGATAAAALLLSLPLDLQTRTVLALLCGPLVGIGVHLAALARAG